MSKKIASARISTSSSELLKELNNSLPFDKELYQEDIKGSLAHSTMLMKQGIISQKDYEDIQKGLRQILDEIESGEFNFDSDDEDIHMAIEKRLTQIIGDAGKRLHTARSRNDQVATDFRLYILKNAKELGNLTIGVIEAFVNLASKNTDTLLPGMTHLQHAQPINFGYHLMAYVQMFIRDYERFESLIDRNSLSPLGCAALAGTTYPIDRELTSQILGFKAPSSNCLDTVSDRDFALEILFDIATLMMHISRFSEEVILWSSSEFAFVKLSDSHSTGSSIMPQKKNPDIPELLRGKTGRAYGNLMSLLTVMKGLPLAYNKDTQEDKEGVFDSIKTAKLSLQVLKEMVEQMSVNKDAMQKACNSGHLSATDLADFLVKEQGMAFRDAYHIVGDVVNRAEELGKDVSELSIDELREIVPNIDEKAIEVLDNRACMNARDSFGGTSSKQTKIQIELAKKWLNSKEDF
jgi:argininosuccinate lyase